MIPHSFEYVAPKLLETALPSLTHGDEAKFRPAASLLPLMKLRLAQPRYVRDIGRFANEYIREKMAHIVIGPDEHARSTSSLLLPPMSVLAETAASLRFSGSHRALSAELAMRTLPRITCAGS